MSSKQTCRTESSYLVKPLFLTVRVLLLRKAVKDILHLRITTMCILVKIQ